MKGRHNTTTKTPRHNHNGYRPSEGQAFASGAEHGMVPSGTEQPDWEISFPHNPNPHTRSSRSRDHFEPDPDRSWLNVAPDFGDEPAHELHDNGQFNGQGGATTPTPVTSREPPRPRTPPARAPKPKPKPHRNTRAPVVAEFRPTTPIGRAPGSQGVPRGAGYTF